MITGDRRRLTTLDMLRGLAALAVVMYHYWHRGPEIYPELGDQIDWTTPGRYGVQVFFVISGFVIFMTLQSATLRHFVTTRFIRLYPTYWVCLTITLAVVTLAGLPGREVGAPAAAVNYTMLQAFGGVTDVDGAYWTLAAEIGFYVQVGILFFAGWLQGRRLIPTMYAWLALVTVVNVLAMASSGIADLLILAPGLIWIPLFVAGMALYLLWTGDRRPAVMALPVVSVAAMAPQGWAVVLAGAVGVAAVFLAPRFQVRGRAGAVLLWLGAISYPLYLLHQNIGFVMLRALDDIGLQQIPATVCAVAGILALASAVTYWIDIPVRRALRARMLPARDLGRVTAG